MLDTSEFDANMELVNMQNYTPSWQRPSRCTRVVIPTRPSLIQRIVRFFFGE